MGNAPFPPLLVSPGIIYLRQRTVSEVLRREEGAAFFFSSPPAQRGREKAERRKGSPGRGAANSKKNPPTSIINLQKGRVSFFPSPFSLPD